MATRNTQGATAQYWSVTVQSAVQPDGNVSAVWVPPQGSAATLTFQGADGSVAQTIGVGGAWQGGWITFPYAVQIISGWTGTGTLVAAGWGAPPNA
jgi:hypothetical protein